MYVTGDPINLIDPTGLKPLPDCVKDFFREFFPNINLDGVEVYNSLPPLVEWLAPIDVGAITFGRHIFFDGSYSPGTVGGFADIGHELVHVSQWYENPPGFLNSGQLAYGISYLGEYAFNRLRGMSRGDAYDANPYEIEAEDFERSVFDMLDESPCLCGE